MHKNSSRATSSTASTPFAETLLRFHTDSYNITSYDTHIREIEKSEK